MTFFIKKTINEITLHKKTEKKKIKIDKIKKNIIKRIKNPEKELIAKTISHIKKYKIIDTTGGIGIDSIIFASLGNKITLIEKQPLIIKILKNLFKSLQEIKFITKNIKIKYGNSIKTIQHLKNNSKNIIYLDPIFPIKKKNDITKAYASIIKNIGSNTKNYKKLFEISLKKAKKLIVKRKKNSESINKKKPTYKISGSKIRFDIYQNFKLPETDSNRWPSG